MEKKYLKDVPDCSKRPISDDELEQVTGGVMYTPCSKCGTMVPLGGICPKCG